MLFSLWMGLINFRRWEGKAQAEPSEKDGNRGKGFGQALSIPSI